MHKNIWVMLILLGAFSASAQQQVPADYDQPRKFLELMNLIRNYYTDTVNEKKLVEDAIVKVLEDLDPHSSFVASTDVKKAEEPLVANFEGIGITFQLLKDTIFVLDVIPSGPSEKVGVMAGDKIILINDTSVAGIKIEQKNVISKLRGPKGTKVKVSMLRRGEPQLLHFTITRDKIPIYSLEASYMATPTTGYIKLTRFAATSLKEMQEALEKLRAQGMQNLILDLQDNLGGYLYTAVDLCNLFLKEKELIVYTEGVHSPKFPYYSDGKGAYQNEKLLVLINEGSASASEILSGCVQDNDRGLVVGRRTWGKGLVQKPFTLSDGSQVKLTTAHYYTPSGRCIQRPYEKGKKDYQDEYSRRANSGELFGSDTSNHFADTVIYKTKMGRTVRGGGGVMPDVFVKLDTSMNSALFNELVRKGVENSFCLEYVDQNRKELTAGYPTADDFFNRFTADDNLIAKYFERAAKDSVVKNDTLYKKSEVAIKTRLKALIGRNLFDNTLFHRIINTMNQTYLKALEVVATNQFNELMPREEKKGNKGGKNKKGKETTSK